jgi:hypothetical protein
MAVMAIMLAATGSRELRGLESSPLVQLAFTASGILFSLLGSVAITVVGYGIWWHRQGRFSFDEPGHWLLVAFASHQVLILFEVLLIVTSATIQGIQRVDAWKQIPFGLSWLVPGAALVILNVYIGRKECAETRWRRVFYANAAAAVVPVLGHMLVLICLERAVRSERSRRPVSSRWKQARGVEPMVAGQVAARPRGFLHWCGVAIAFVDAGMMVLVVIGILAYIIVPAFF